MVSPPPKSSNTNFLGWYFFGGSKVTQTHGLTTLSGGTPLHFFTCLILLSQQWNFLKLNFRPFFDQIGVPPLKGCQIVGLTTLWGRTANFFQLCDFTIESRCPPPKGGQTMGLNSKRKAISTFKKQFYFHNIKKLTSKNMEIGKKFGPNLPFGRHAFAIYRIFLAPNRSPIPEVRLSNKRERS